ncbi:MAG: sugar phosphate nucleotidyltransferase [Candidatus Marinimicrobia bacterium]|jgi:UTP-glucose-1-phosphate uridylyltransferase|nr:sugar phosphate nucleotidyltransferase [Candidatus Neomarinimicrobiota bacterium]MDP6611202.1 sugar phosphate nucleotidyltransferase [Candidatus Neomarinimicrobiota bacterium]|tara:strand:+ start:75037 stop:75918 length:882 start_codon:yes stop_codon:yes gene_type:complete
MNKLSLLVMAAGMGSRYGGLKQLDAVGPNGETIIDYSVYDAIRSGFTKVVFIIRKDFEEQFKTQVTDKYAGKIQVKFAFQDIHDLPDGFSCPDGREKPWGTGQAILSAKNLINEPFAAINGDDFYGEESFKTIAEYYQSGGDSFSMVAFRLENTLSIFGGVTRGLCTVKDGKLDTVIETNDLQKTESGVSSDRDIELDGSEPVSMNMWGFTPVLFDYLEDAFVEFLKKDGQELKSEFLIPSIVNELIHDGQESVHVLSSAASWFGVTYKEDKAFVVGEIQKLVSEGAYPKQLF